MSNIDADFLRRREMARSKVNALDRDSLPGEPERRRFFEQVYEQASGDPALVPWADLKPKDQLLQWLAKNSGINSLSALSALDVACGLGDNAEAVSEAGYETTAFDLSSDAINWAKRRFPKTKVKYQSADILDLPASWNGAFDLVNECYTLQSVPPEMLNKMARAISALVKPGGTLLIYARVRKDGVDADGPPWPLEEKSLNIFLESGFELVNDMRFDLEKNERKIPHVFAQWRKLEGQT